MVLDSYRLIQRLGKGHSATVWKGEVLRQPPGIRLTQGDVVAIKVYDQALLSGHESIRIQREFAVASEVDHPCLTKVFDVVISPSRPWHTFLVMEYVAGRTLKQHLSDQGPLETRAVLSIGKQLFDGLDALHTGGALHRDVKAANIILVDPQQVRVKLLDFGIVSVDADQGLTASSVFLGSKHSAPLEQLTGKTLDVRADIYSVGTVLFHCYEGRPPYENAGPEGGIVERMLNNPDVLKSKGPADSALTAFINRCLDNNRGRRPATASDARSEIEALIRGSGPTTGIWTPPSRGK
jgi:serine/threonine-protein kinase